jgi:hypothetical protein
METYIPEKINLFTQLISNAFTQLILVGLICFLIFTFLFNSPKTQPRFTTTNHRKIFSTGTPPPSPNEKNTQSPPSTTQTMNPPTNKPEVVVVTNNETVTQKLAGIDADKKRTLDKTNFDKKNEPSFDKNLNSTNHEVSFYINYYEVDRNLIEEWFRSESLDSSTITDLKIGKISMTQFRQQIRTKPLLSQSKKVKLNKNEVLPLLGYFRDNHKEFIGIETDLEIKLVRNNEINLNLNFKKKFSQASEPPIALQLKSDLNKDYVTFIRWNRFLSGYQHDMEIQNLPPFNILKSESYLNRNTDLIIILYSDFIFDSKATIPARIKSE